MFNWKKSGKKIAAVFTAAILAGGSLGGAVHASEPQKKEMVKLSVPDNKVPVYQYGKAQDFVLNIENTGDEELKDIKIAPDLKGEDYDKWPFRTACQNYSEEISKLSPGETGQVKFNFTQREDVETTRYVLCFAYEADAETSGKISGSASFYVNTTKKPQENKETAQTKKTETAASKTSEKTSGEPKTADAGSFSNWEPSYSDGGTTGGSSDGSVPRVIVTGFSTDPEKVKAGSDFTLTIHLKNTSRKSKVQNMLFDLNAPVDGADEQTTAPAFLPSSGSSSIYLESMKANGTADISIKLNAKSDLLQKPYSVELNMKYEDAGHNGVEAVSSISIPVKQDARFEFSEFEINPESISVDDEVNVMCSLYNMGRIKLYNVKAVFEGACIEKEEIFVGNVESGATASIDAMLKGTKPSGGPSPVTMTMSYENEEGEVSVEKKELMLDVTEEESANMDVMMPEEEPESGGFPVFPVAAVALIAAAVILFVAFRKHRKRRSIADEEELLYELDGASEDERQ